MQAIGNALCATGFGESIAGLIFSPTHSALAERAVAAAVIVALTLVNVAGVKWVIRSGRMSSQMLIYQYIIYVVDIVLDWLIFPPIDILSDSNSPSLSCYWRVLWTSPWEVSRMKMLVRDNECYY